MAGNFPIGGEHGLDRGRIARHGHGDAVDGDRQMPSGEESVKPPKSSAAAIFIDRFRIYLACAGERLRTHGFRQEGLGCAIAVKDAVFAALLVVDDELQSEAGIGRPMGMGRIGAVSHHVARVIGETGR